MAAGQTTKTESYFTNARNENHVNIAYRNKDGCVSLTGWMMWLPCFKRNKLKSLRCYMYDNYPLYPHFRTVEILSNFAHANEATKAD